MMFKRKSVYAAVLAGLGAVGVAGTASAVHVNPDGLGQVLIYPYYTVRTAATTIASGQYNTYISVTNTSPSAKAVKVRFLEGKGSKEVLDFNLFLSGHDVWTGSIEPTTTGAHLVSSDKSCTTGVIPAAGQDFSNAAYSGSNADGEDATLDRTREGYVELIEMGVVTHAGLLTAITHVNGVAPCTSATLAAADAAGLSAVYLLPPEGGLLGGASLVNPLTGVDYTYDAVAMNNWTAVIQGTGSTSLAPNLGSGSVATSEVFANGAIRTATWAATLPATATANANAVSAAIMHDNVMNEFVLDAATVSATDWVVTFPTKRLYVGIDPTPRTHTATASFPFNENFGLGGSCDTVVLTQYDREEQTTVASGGFSPSVTVTTDLCWEANVISFNGGAILGSVNSYNTNVSYANGWMNLGLNHGPYISGSDTILTAVAGTSATNFVLDGLPNYRGLPVVGFMVQDFTNSTLVTGTGATPGAAFGGNFIHKYTRLIN